MSDFYQGFRVIPDVMDFYTLGTIDFSEVNRVSRENDIWNLYVDVMTSTGVP